jgi:EgtB-related family protein
MLDAAGLAQALRDVRADTLAAFAELQAALGEVPQVPQRGDLNPPLWELGHVGWFQAHFLDLADAAAGDALYDSSRVAHARRWTLPLPSPAETRATLAAQLEQALAALKALEAPTAPTGPTAPAAGHRADTDTDATLYRHRLVLFHEDMHHEAALYMGQALGLPLHDGRWQAPRLTRPRRELRQAPGSWTLGWAGPGFAFDNELGAHEVPLGETRIDSRVLSWAEYLPFVEATGAPPPRYLRRERGRWQRLDRGLDPDLPACHLTLAEAEAWCTWAGRRLPDEAEWERAALQDPAFEWGAVWEWTASRFTAYPGFVPHAYADYSAPWFGSRQVLRGASFMTQPRLHHAKYRNFFTADRADVAVGFRSCARRD